MRKAVLHVHADPAIRFNLVEFAGGSQVPPHPSPTANYWFVPAVRWRCHIRRSAAFDFKRLKYVFLAAWQFSRSRKCPGAAG